MAELSSEEKLMDLQAQLRGCELCGSKVIRCPYCRETNNFAKNDSDTSPELCCEKFACAMAAILGRMQLSDDIDFCERLMDKAEGQAVFN